MPWNQDIWYSITLNNDFTKFFVRVKFHSFHTANSLYWIIASEIWYILLSSLVSKIPETEKGFFFLEENYIFAIPFQVKQNLVAAIPGSQVSFPFFMAFISLLSNIELIKKIYLNATNGSRTIEITKGTSFICKIIVRFLLFCTISINLFSEEFLHSAQMMSQITPLEVDILFVLCDLLHQTG